MYSAPVKIEKCEISKELSLLLKQWKQEIDGAQNLSASMMKEIYRQCRQRIKKITSESQGNDRSCSREALIIGEFLTKNVGIPQNNDTSFKIDV